MSVEEVTVTAFVEPGEPLLIVPAEHWRILVWLFAELDWKYRNHHHVTRDGNSRRFSSAPFFAQ